MTTGSHGARPQQGRWTTLARRALARTALGAIVAWSAGALWLAPIGGHALDPLRPVLACAFLGAVVFAFARLRRGELAVLGACAVAGLLWLTVRPSNARDWAPEQAVLPFAEVNGDLLTIRGVRACEYRSLEDFDVRFEDRTYDMKSLTGAWFVLEEIDPAIGLAHAMITFGFEDGRCLAVSVEIRREKGERYSPLRGLFRNYELMYVFADESDVIRLRTTIRGHRVYLFPIASSPTRLRAMLLLMLDRANALLAAPRFYNTLTETCTTTIMEHANRVADVEVPWSLPVVLPTGAARLAYRLGLLPRDSTFEELQSRCMISDRAREWAGDGSFSAWIRR